MAEMFDPVSKAKMLLHLSEDSIVSEKSAATKTLVNELTELQRKPAQLKAVVNEMEKETRTLWSHIWVQDQKNACGDITTLVINDAQGGGSLFQPHKSLTFDLSRDNGKQVLPSCVITDQTKHPFKQLE